MKLLTGLRLPVTQRVYVPDAHGSEGYVARAHVVSQVDLEEMGPDVVLTVRLRGESFVAGRLKVRTADSDAVIERLLRHVPPVDRELFQALMDELQEASVAVDTDRITLVRRRLLAILDTMAADLAIAGGVR